MIENSSPLKVLLLYGTRPEVIKMAPVVAALRQRPDRFAVTVCATAQHREMLDQAQDLFALRADVDLDLMRPDQSLNDLAARSFAALDPILGELAPDWVLVQGDTTTAMVGAFAAFHRGVKVGHIEAGLRTGDLKCPFPEEANRRAIDLLAAALFAPTAHAGGLLLAEGADPRKVFVTGNTVVDALLSIAQDFGDAPDTASVLITVHRRESFGAPLREVFRAVRRLAELFPELRWVFPMHRNPKVWEPAQQLLAGLPNLELHEPFGYREMVSRLRSARLVLTDSGGLQEEAPTFGKPVLVLRDKTERPEGVDAGVARLVGTDGERIIAETARLLTDDDAYCGMTNGGNPYGDGLAAERITAILSGRPFAPFVPDGPLRPRAESPAEGRLLSRVAAPLGAPGPAIRGRGVV
ncbi:MAG TPA: UDP-N-acetylglucosamine 2-epimerase (non-hydrolyzing) [Thermoanaerobaculia bacterium]|nr:UDP-N-acetylglucosamine 2-epimerase (non-hydrolyzing) [Thermoanaerobaculia bacterium]